ncbi:hypothetical protein BC832DRAFT_155017 [Gaertneriomyces semiglobifer]|nr:hypothetical protein BC832DRAFT_155017 [Gaertneriomyces semiglobifer]
MSRPQRKRKEVIYKEVTSLDGDENDYQPSSPKKQKPSRKAAEKTQKANAASPGARQENGGRLSVRERREQADLALALRLSASENGGDAISEPVPAADEDPLLAYDTAKPRSKAKPRKSGGEDLETETKRSTSDNSSQHEEELSDVESADEDDEEDFDFKSKSKRKLKSTPKEAAPKPTSKVMSRVQLEPAKTRQSRPASKAKRDTESSSVIAPILEHAITRPNPLAPVTPGKIAMRTPATASTPQLEQSAQPEATSTFTSCNSSILPPYINKLPIRIGLSRKVSKPLLKTIGRKQP